MIREVSVDGHYGARPDFNVRRRQVQGIAREKARPSVPCADASKEATLDTMFQPDEVIFAPTGRCNLTCAHCRVRRGPEELPVADAIAFLESCEAGGIERLGFSGGEPFLRTDFLVAISKAAVERGLYFDRLMTNGDWWPDETELRSTLVSVRDAGFDGMIGLSYDSYHGQTAGRIAAFLGAVFDVWGRKDTVELLSVRSADDASFLLDLETVAAALGGRLERGDDGEPVRILDEAYASRTPADPDDGSGLVIPVIRSPRSASADEGSWDSPRWFKDDFCEGPGNVFYVHPDGSVAVCCGFANENQPLLIGSTSDSYETLMANAAGNAHVRACFDKGLGAVRAELESSGTRFPGKTADICFFCDYVCRGGLVENPGNKSTFRSCGGPVLRGAASAGTPGTSLFPLSSFTLSPEVISAYH